MTISSEPAEKPAKSERPSAPSQVRAAEVRHAAPVYGRAFWCSYAANLTLMVAITLLFRYADFVTFLGGSELDLGWIVGAGMIGSMAMRFAQGVGIDRYGPRTIWLLSLMLFAASALAHLMLTTVHGPAIYLLRIAFATSVAGAFGASITSVAGSMPAAHMAEVIGMLGTSGFIAMAVGPLLGDWIVGSTAVADKSIYRMFTIAAALAACSFVCACVATAGHLRPTPRRRPHVFWVIRRYHPGAVLLVAIGTGIGVSLPPTFLPRFAAEQGIEHIATFFAVYAATAFTARILTRGLAHRIGLRAMIFLGLGSLIVSLLAYLLVHVQWQFIVPGFFGGIAHALLFPSVVASGSTAFPGRHRGLGTTVMLAMLDLGTLIGAPLAGGILYHTKRLDMPAYPTMFVSIAVVLAFLGLSYWVLGRNERVRPAAYRLGMHEASD